MGAGSNIADVTKLKGCSFACLSAPEQAPIGEPGVLGRPNNLPFVLETRLMHRELLSCVNSASFSLNIKQDYYQPTASLGRRGQVAIMVVTFTCLVGFD